MNRMLLVSSLVMLLALPVQAGWNVVEDLPARSGQLLEVDLETGGSIDVRGWDRDEVHVEAQIIRGSTSEIDFDIRQTDNGVAVHSELLTRGRSTTEIEVVINVPAQFDLDLHTNGGSLRIEGIEGRIDGETMGGELVLSDLHGEIRLTTMGGEIRLSDSEVNGRVKTMGGNVHIREVMGDVEAMTMGGNVVYDNVQTASGSAACREVMIETMGGNIEAPDAPCGANLETMGGNIRIGEASEYVKAETMGGNITIGSIDGWVRATTMGGNVSVRMTGDPRSGQRDVRLVSMSGDIELTVPDGLSMKIDISLAYTKGSKQNYEIVSDFPLKISRTENWDYEDGSPRKYIRGTGSTADGEHKIKIETINGDVYLKKD